jgi:hypothetical protein
LFATYHSAICVPENIHQHTLNESKKHHRGLANLKCNADPSIQAALAFFTNITLLDCSGWATSGSAGQKNYQKYWPEQSRCSRQRSSVRLSPGIADVDEVDVMEQPDVLQ